MELKEGLNVIIGPDKITNSVMNDLKSSLNNDFLILNKETKLDSVRKMLDQRKNLVLHTHNDEIIDMADNLFGVLDKGKLVPLKI